MHSKFLFISEHLIRHSNQNHQRQQRQQLLLLLIPPRLQRLRSLQTSSVESNYDDDELLAFSNIAKKNPMQSTSSGSGSKRCMNEHCSAVKWNPFAIASPPFTYGVFVWKMNEYSTYIPIFGVVFTSFMSRCVCKNRSTFASFSSNVIEQVENNNRPPGFNIRCALNKRANCICAMPSISFSVCLSSICGRWPLPEQIGSSRITI